MEPGRVLRPSALPPGREGVVLSLSRSTSEAQPLGATGKYLARYRGREGFLVYARNALGTPIVCDSAELALSVARYRVQRLKPSGELNAD